MSKEQPPVRDVIPYKSGKRVSTFRKLNVGLGGTALEQALLEQQQRQQAVESEDQPLEISSKGDDTPHHHSPSPPLPTTPHHSPAEAVNQSSINSIQKAETSDLQEFTVFRETPHHQSPPVTTTPQPNSIFRHQVAPDKDFNKRANSIERDALPSGTFPGSTKKLYDALYLRTRGAKNPTRTVQASRRDLLNWTGIRNLKTIDNHIRYLMAKGLVVRHWELGSNDGAKYEIVLPEEAFDTPSPPVTTTGGDSPPVTTPQKLGIPTTRFLGSGGEGQTIENNASYAGPKTFNTDDDNDDEYTHTLREFARIIEQAAQEVCGGGLSFTDQERLRWRELAEVLSVELKSAAQRAGSISSAPAFFAAHLRRTFSKKETPREQQRQTKNLERIKPLSQVTKEEETGLGNVKSKFSFDERRRYAQNQHPPLGNGWIVESASGKYDEVIGAWIREHSEETGKTKTIDASQCPDCRGSGMYYPGGYEKGATKCRHTRLLNEEHLEQAAPS